MSKKIDKSQLREYASAYSLYLAKEALGARVRELRTARDKADKELHAKVRSYVEKKLKGVVSAALVKLKNMVPDFQEGGLSVHVYKVHQTHVVVSVKHVAGSGPIYGFAGPLMGPCCRSGSVDDAGGMLALALQIHVPSKAMNREVCEYLLADQRVRDASTENDSVYAAYQEALEHCKIGSLRAQELRAEIRELSTTEEGKKTLSECGITV